MDEPEAQQPGAGEGPDADESIPSAPPEPVSADDLLSPRPEGSPAVAAEDVQMRALLEALVYVTEEPLTVPQIAGALQQPEARVQQVLDGLMAEFDRPEHGVYIKEVAGGYKMATKPEHHETVRSFVKSLKPPLKLSLPALETLAVIAYKQPVTAPEIMEIRGVQGAGVLKTLLDRKLIAAAGRKNVIGKPILYKTTREFLVQFGLKDLAELPSLKEFEEIRRMAFADEPQAPAEDSPAPPAAGEEPVAAGDSVAAQGPEGTGEAAGEPEAGPEAAPEPAESGERAEASLVAAPAEAAGEKAEEPEPPAPAPPPPPQAETEPAAGEAEAELVSGKSDEPQAAKTER